jgi:hypothetical protein
MDSSVSAKDEIWFLRVCHHISTGLYNAPHLLSMVKLLDGVVLETSYLHTGREMTAQMFLHRLEK